MEESILVALLFMMTGAITIAITPGNLRTIVCIPITALLLIAYLSYMRRIKGHRK